MLMYWGSRLGASRAYALKTSQAGCRISSASLLPALLLMCATSSGNAQDTINRLPENTSSSSLSDLLVNGVLTRANVSTGQVLSCDPANKLCTLPVDDIPELLKGIPGLPIVPGVLEGVEGVLEDPVIQGLLSRSVAVLSQVVNNASSVALSITQDVASSVLDVKIEPETAVVVGPFAASSPGAASSMFMVSGYKHLSHDGYSVSSDFGPATGKGPEFEEDNYGLTVGTRFDGSDLFGTEKGSVTIGVLANYTHTDIDVGAVPNVPGNFKSGSVSIDSWSVGGYGMVTDGRYYGLVTVTGTFGSPEAENALLPATAETNTFGFAASAMSGVLVPVGGAKLDLRGGLNYLHSSSDDFTDSVGSRFTDARMEEFSGTLSARLFSVMRVDDYNVRPFVQGGVNYRFHYENEITVDNATFAFDELGYQHFRPGRLRHRRRPEHTGLSRRPRRRQ